METLPSDLEAADRWILSEFSGVLDTVKIAWENIDIFTAARSIKNFGMARKWLRKWPAGHFPTSHNGVLIKYTVGK